MLDELEKGAADDLTLHGAVDRLLEEEPSRPGPRKSDSWCGAADSSSSGDKKMLAPGTGTVRTLTLMGPSS
jgi:hypothetical protein